MSLITTSDSENPIKIYLREIGEAQLITPEEEIRLAHLISRAQKAEKELKEAKAVLTARRQRAANPKSVSYLPPEILNAPVAPALPANGAAKTGHTRPFAKDEASVRKLEGEVRAGNEARQIMIKANLRLVVKIAQDYANFGLPLLDLISEGNIGLMKAVERFEPAKGAKLSTYAAWWIKQAVKRALANQGKTIRLPVHLADKISRMRRLSNQLAEEFGREPTDDELAEELKISVYKVSQLRNASIRPCSLNSTVGDADGAELGELVSDEMARRPDDLIGDEDVTLEMLKMLDILDKREREILSLRYGLDGNRALTLEEVGERFNVTRERIRQLQNIGLKKLRRAMFKKDYLGRIENNVKAQAN